MHASWMLVSFLKLSFNPSSPFWANEQDNAGDTHDHFHVLDAAFVDDQAIILVANGHWVLSRAISLLLDILTDVFGKFRLEINGQGEN